MKRILLFVTAALLTVSMQANNNEVKVHHLDTTSKVKTGWNFGVLPSVAFDADLGFQGGALANVYYYGDGSQYPEYIHSIYAEAAYTTKNYGIFRVNFDKLGNLARLRPP